MAGEKTILKDAIIASANTLKGYDGTPGKTPTDAMNKFATDLPNAIDTYVKSLTIQSTIGQITASGMANSGGPVVATAVLISKAI